MKKLDNVATTGKNIMKKINKEKVIYWGKYVLVLFAGILLGFFIKGKMSGQSQMGLGGMGQATVLTRTVQKQPVALGKNFIAKVEAINAADVIPVHVRASSAWSRNTPSAFRA